MKKTLIFLLLGEALIYAPVSCLADGYFLFNNLGAYDGTPNSQLPYISPFAGSGAGSPGAIIGSGGSFNYSISFLANTDLSLSNSSAIHSSSGTILGQTTSFFGATGDAASGAGIFDGGNGIIPGTFDGQHVLVQLVAWYNPTGNLTYNQSFLVGFSSVMNLRLAAGPDPIIADFSGMAGFPVGLPEPSSFALLGLGATSLWFFRRRR